VPGSRSIGWSGNLHCRCLVRSKYRDCNVQWRCNLCAKCRYNGRGRTILGTATALTANAPSLPSAGGSVTLTAEVTSTSASAISPTGEVTFFDQSGAVLCSAVTLTGGSAICPTTIASAPDTVRADYHSGDTNFVDSSESVTITALQANATVTTLVASPTSIPPSGATVAFTATVTSPSSPTGGPALDGTVTFSNQAGVILCQSVPLNLGSAPCSSPIASAPNTVTASYTPSTTGYLSSSGSTTVTAIAPGSCIPPVNATTCAVTLYSIPDSTHSGFAAPVPGTITTVQTNNGVTTSSVNNLNPLGVTIYDNVNGPPLNAPICNYEPAVGCPTLNYHHFQVCAVDGKYTPVSYNSVVSDQVPLLANSGCTGSPNVNNTITGYTLSADGVLTGTDTSTASQNISCTVPYVSGPGSYTTTATLQNAKNDPISMNLKDGSGNASVSETRQSNSTNSLDPSQNQTSTTSVTGTQTWPAESVSPPQFSNTGIVASTTSVPAGQALPQACTVGTP
jgi:hypothetical protein